MRKYLFVILLFMLISCAEGQTAVPTHTPSPAPTPTSSLTITEADKIKLIKIATRWGIGQLPGNNDLVQAENKVYLTTDNLDPTWIPTFDNFQITTRTREEIQQIATAEDRIIMYLAFGDIEFGDDGKAQIVIGNFPVLPDGGGAELGGEAQLEFERINGEWAITMLWIAVS